jgi:hypothetical protein
MPTRRSFIQTSAMLGAATTLSLEDVANAFARTRAISVRRNIYSLAANSPEVAALKAGVQAMKALNPATGLPTNKKSWLYQRGIHKWTSPAPNPVPVAWNTCTHHGVPGPAFLSWHRAYLYYFERICRSVSGNANFMLPYWNYDNPGQDALPPVFLDPASPLYHASRGINDGSVIDAISRGAQATIGTADFSTFHSDVEDCHDNTHGAIGGDMGGIRTSPLDPIFYLHHCNLDRCWRHWQLQHQGSGNPTPLPSWWTTSWTFFDENQSQVAMTGQQAEHATSLGYRYDDEPLRVRPFVFDQVQVRNICQRYPFLCRPIRVVQVPPWPLPVRGPRPLPLPVRLPAAAANVLAQTKREAGANLQRGLLAMELVLDWREGSPPLLVEARRAGMQGDTGWVAAGAASAFSRGGTRDTVQIDVSQVFDRLGTQQLRDLEWRVRFFSGRRTKAGREVPLGNVVAANARVLAAQLTMPAGRRR